MTVHSTFKILASLNEDSASENFENSGVERESHDLSAPQLAPTAEMSELLSHILGPNYSNDPTPQG